MSDKDDLISHPVDTPKPDTSAVDPKWPVLQDQPAPLVADSEEALARALHEQYSDGGVCVHAGKHPLHSMCAVMARRLITSGTVCVVAPGVIDREARDRAYTMGWNGALAVAYTSDALAKRDAEKQAEVINWFEEWANMAPISMAREHFGVNRGE